jgi:hypothetical protein
MIAYLGIALLASGGAVLLARRAWAAALLAALMLLELRAAPIRWYLGTGRTPAVYRWLATLPHRGSVAELPLEQGSAYAAQFWSHLHRRPLVNGVSGFIPPHYAAMQAAWKQTPIPDSLFDTLRAREATIVLVHRDRLGRRAAHVDDWLRRQVRRGLVTHAGDIENVGVYATHASVQLPRLSPSASALQHTVHWELITGPLDVSGIAPDASRVVLHFDNHLDSFEARVSGGRFHRRFEQRPRGVRADTDLQVEIIRRDGSRELLPQVWLRWRKDAEKLRPNQLPQTADLGPYLVHPRHEDGTERPRM